jgi:hypothetical protein
MNSYDIIFFTKYLSEGTEMKAIIHRHIIVVLNKIILNYFFWAILPAFLYYYSDVFKVYVPFFVLEIFLIFMFFKWLYDIFNWYNDVWIVTDDWVVDFKWKLFSIDSTSIKYESIEWIELIQNWIIDTFLGKWDLEIHKVWWEEFYLDNVSVPYEAIEEIENNAKWHHHDEHEEHEEHEDFKENYEIIVKALSWVVEDYLVKSWYKKDDSKEKKEIVKNAKKAKWTIDLSWWDDEDEEEHHHTEKKSHSKENHGKHDEHEHYDGHWHH